MADEFAVVLPASLRNAIARTETIVAENKARRDGKPPVTVNGNEPPTPAAPVQPPPAPPVPVYSEPVPAPTPQPEDNWEHRYRAIKGRYDQQGTQIQQMSQRLRDMEALLATVANPPPPAQPAPPRLVTDDDIKEYSPEFFDVVGRRAEEIAALKLAPLRAELEQLRAQVGGVRQNIVNEARGRMLATLTDRLPEWDDINRSDEFKHWCQLTDPYSGVIRVDLLRSAYNSNQTDRVLNIFNGFIAETAAIQPAATATPQRNAPAPSRVDLASLAAPGRARQAAAVAPAPSDKPAFTTPQIKDLYARRLRGDFKGKDAEWTALEASIYAAGREGRISPA